MADGRNDVDDRYWTQREQSQFERNILTRFAALERDVSKMAELPAKVEKNHDTVMAELRMMRSAAAAPSPVPPAQDQAYLAIHRLVDMFVQRGGNPQSSWVDRVTWAIAAAAIGFFVSHIPGVS